MTNPMTPPPYSLGQCIARLSPRARARIADLRALVSDATALQRTLMERIDATREECQRLHLNLARAALPGGDADAAKQLGAELAALSDKLDQLERERSRRNSVAANTQQLVSRLENFVSALFSGASDLVAPPAVEVRRARRDGESVTAAITRLRGDIGRTRAELAAVRNAPLPADEVKAATVECIDRMAVEGRPSVAVEGTKVVVRWPDEVEFFAPGQGGLSAPSGGASKLMCWLHHDELIARFTEGIVDSPGAIPAAARPGRIRDLEHALFTLEVEEEHWVGEAIAAGLDCHRRIDASPWAILGWGLPAEAPPSYADAAE